MTSTKAAQCLLVRMAAAACGNHYQGLQLQTSTYNAGQGGSKQSCLDGLLGAAPCMLMPARQAQSALTFDPPAKA